MTVSTADGLQRWMLRETSGLPTTAKLVEEFCARLVDIGVPVARMLLSIRTIHPQIIAYTYAWKQAKGPVSEVDRVRRDITEDPEYLMSPVKRIHDGEDELRRHLIHSNGSDEFTILADLKKDGYTDYVIFGLPFSDGLRNTISFASKSPDGFTEAHLMVLRDLLPILSLLLEVRSGRRMAMALLDTYVGHEAGERIMLGEVVRGEGQHIHAVIWYADLKDFTKLSDTRPMEEVIAVLDDWFESMTHAIHGHGGQVLKFIGDGLLAIFPLGDAAFRHYTCRQAMNAALEAQAAVATLNEDRERAGQSALDYRLALHVGDLMWGNIGAVDRLDFTAIGPSVNLTARLEALCGDLGVHMVLSKDFADIARENYDIVSLGEHPLRGVTDPQEVFTLRQELEAGSGPREQVFAR